MTAKLKFDRQSLAALLAKLPQKADLTFVHDQGLYIMSHDEPRPAHVPATEKYWQHTVVYARGYEPDNDKNPDWWEKGRAAVGGDDFAEAIGTAQEFRAMLDASEGDLVLNVTAKSIGVAYLPKRTPEQVAARKKVIEDWLAKVRAPGAPAEAFWSPKFKATVRKAEKELKGLTAGAL